MPSSKNRRKQQRKAQRDRVRLALIDSNKEASIKQGLQIAAEKLLFVEDKSILKPQTWEQVEILKKQQRKSFTENFKDTLDRTREKVMRPDFTPVSVNPLHAPAQSSAEKHFEKLVKREERKQQKTEDKPAVVVTTKKKKALVSIWDNEDKEAQKRRDENILNKSFIPDVLREKNILPSFAEERARKHQAKRLKKAKVILPLSGQSYNPDSEALRKTLEIATLQESHKALKIEKMHEKLTVRDQEELAAVGDDEWDGLLARERPDEPQDPSTLLQPKPKPKPKYFVSQVKLKKHKIQKANEARHRARRRAMKENANLMNYAAAAESHYTRLAQMQDMKRKLKAIRRVEDQFKEDFPVQSVTDIIMPDAITSSLRSHDNHSWSLWTDRLVQSHKSGLNDVPSLTRKTKKMNY